MRYRQLGVCGPTVSVVGLGASHFGRVCDQQQTRAVVDAAIDAGINFIDTAVAYPGSEDLLGPALQGRRQKVLVASKFGHPANHPASGRGTPAAVRASLEGTLRRLRSDYLDVFMMHMPDPETPIEETLVVLDDLVRTGLVRYIGLSNFDASQISETQSTARQRRLTEVVCVQSRYNLLNREIERDVVPLCSRLGLGMIPYEPLASGLLSGRYRRGEPVPTGTLVAARLKAVDDQTFDRLEQLEHLAQTLDVTLLQLAVGWLVAQPGVGLVLTGATHPSQIAANALAGDREPSPAGLAAIDAIGAPTPLVRCTPC